MFQELSRATLKEHFKEKSKEIENDKRFTTKEINVLEKRLKNLKKKWLDDKIVDEDYFQDKEEMDNNLNNLEEKKKAINQ